MGERGSSLGPGGVVVEMGTFMVAGHDTTASGQWEKGDRGLGSGAGGGGWVGGEDGPISSRP